MPIGIGTAILGAGALGAGASLAGGFMQANAAGKAIDAQRGMFNTARGIEQPFINAGYRSLPMLEALTGSKGGGGAIVKTLEGLPGYRFMLDQGLKSTQNSYAAQGLGASGAALKGAAQFSTGLASSNLGQFYNMLLGQSQLGAGAGGTLSGGAITTGQGIAQSTQNQGTAMAAGLTGATNSLSGGINNYLGYNLLSSIYGAKGGAASNYLNPNTSVEMGTAGWPGTT